MRKNVNFLVKLKNSIRSHDVPPHARLDVVEDGNRREVRRMAESGDERFPRDADREGDNLLAYYRLGREGRDETACAAAAHRPTHLPSTYRMV
jgi:hypothetical protein